MKIVQIVCRFLPYTSGIGNVCLNESRELVKLGHDIVVFTPRYKKENIIENKFLVRYFRPILKYGNAAFIPQIISQLKNFDIIYLHWPFIGATEIILLWKIFKKFLSGIRPAGRHESTLIVRYHMDLIGQGITGFFFKIYSFIFLPLLIKYSNKIIVSTFDYLRHSQIKRYFKKYPNKFIEIPFGVDLVKFSPKQKNKNLLRKYKIDPDNQIILFVGGLDRAHYFKGVNILLKAIAKLKSAISDFKLLIIGNGNLRPFYEKIAKDLRVGDRVVFVGRIPDQSLPDFYNLANIFILPSTTKSEAFGLVLLEAMACAKPIIVSNLPGPRTLVKKNINGLLVKPGDVGDLMEKLKFLLENKKIAKEWGINSRKLVEEKYNWSVIGQKIEEVYKKVLTEM
ncbi:glycosyltransferase family 4 protein [bacterium]|nr:glycosyltransferase family 4 protein [bacterium]